jgi:hypothetical protein
MSMDFRFTVRATVLAGVLALLGLSFMWGFVVEVLSVADGREYWAYLLVVGPWALVLMVALVVLLGRSNLLLGPLVGLVLGSLAAALFVVGVVSPFFMELGDRDLTDVGGDLSWEVSLMLGMIVWGGGGAVAGAVCGGVASALKAGLGWKSTSR